MNTNRCPQQPLPAPLAACGCEQRFESRWPGYRYWFSDGVPAVVS